VVAPTPFVLSERVIRFGRLLRAAGVKLGPGQVLEGLQALEVVDVTKKLDFFWALHCAWVKRREDHEVFSEAFRLFWRDPDRPVNRVLEELLASSRFTSRQRSRQAHRRILDALAEESGRDVRPRAREADTVRLASSDVERLREKDFEQMTSSELREAARVIERFRFPAREMATRRWAAVTRRADLDLRRTVRAGMRRGRDHLPLHWRRRRTRPPGIVALCDISGSMAGYTRMLLRFLHALTNDRDRVYTFLFGTRLSNVTRSLRRRDIDAALAELGRRVGDWEGGTRIGTCLTSFNVDWARRVLAQGAVVLLITDGLDRGEAGVLDREMARLRRSARRVVWLNPLLRYAAFRPEARGIREILPHVDDFRPAHNLVSLEALADVLSASGPALEPPKPGA
jgi:uncharacterized protein with von Willebrand factor type A (vWA) domain